MVVVRKELVEYLNSLDDKSRRIVRTKLFSLEDNPYLGSPGDKERLSLPDDTVLYRMHIGRTWTVLYRVDEESKTVKIIEMMTIEQAHKKYGRL
jgi:mRNA-degrading endonuclease RelE of RelBE toxin-antitoxin system